MLTRPSEGEPTETDKALFSSAPIEIPFHFPTDAHHVTVSPPKRAVLTRLVLIPHKSHDM